jgi:hypothetical protein
LNSTNPPDVEGTKRKNITDMALDFTAMMRLFVRGSKGRIAAKLEELFLGLGDIRDRDEYEVRHRMFCEWFRGNIRTAEKTRRKGGLQPSGPASYGQAAKILDIAIKVYVYYCTQPNPAIAERIGPFLHGAIDTPIMEHLKKSKPGCTTIRATTIKGLDEEAYRALQAVLLAQSHEERLNPVQYDDILWRRLNRRPPENRE